MHVVTLSIEPNVLVDLEINIAAMGFSPPAEEERPVGLHLRVNDRPSWKEALLFGCQQATVCISGLLVFPFLVSQLACAGDQTIALRVQLISATFVACGIATLLQTTLGLRLSILNGTAFSFLPPLLAFSQLPENRCEVGQNVTVPEEEWKGRIQTISGSLVMACLVFITIGATGAVGVFSKFVGPITIVPLLILLTMSTVPTLDEKLSLHWISIVMVLVLIVVVIYLDDVHLPIPTGIRPFRVTRVRVFGQFPYLISVCSVWLLCLILTLTGAEPEEGEARVDKAATMRVLTESPWVQVPYPGQFGTPRIDIGLMCGFMASAVSSVIENLGSYAMAARVSEQRRPPRSTVNRAIIVEGLGSMIAALFGVCSGVTTYTENIALIHITRVASRITMQIAGTLLIGLGLFTKASDSIVFSLKLIDLRVTRNIAIMGMSMMLGMVIPTHFEKNPLNTGNPTLDSTLNMLLTIKMLCGGGIAFVLDNTVPGATAKQRGLHEDDEGEPSEYQDEDGYSFPDYVNRVFHALPFLKKLPFLPSEKNLAARASQSKIYPEGQLPK
ncbi:hypothetical protein PRIPAC_78742 [Pristionchus pacificus]|uniref:Uncharacterized protein n=1 Tax=Pristionchus pacificus TaxID=54126 RepID=A0A2A6BXV3_PRIPA|nr:hypothetical protein PRIPAC_78742 [Pristionchus pacificus]|eukprot:PDM70832.1 hypothetical protein PRIPAC_45036 [Pristionchus pacificus]